MKDKNFQHIMKKIEKELKERKKIYRLATKLLKKEESVQDVYHTSIANNQDFLIVNEKKFFIDVKYSKQVVEINKLRRNLKKLDFIEQSKNVSYATKIDVCQMQTLVEDALKIYKNGKDTTEFDKDVESLNTFLSSHIVFRVKDGGPRLTFRMFCRKDYKSNEYLRSGSKSPAQLIANRRTRFDALGQRFDEILRPSNKEKVEKTRNIA